MFKTLSYLNILLVKKLCSKRSELKKKIMKTFQNTINKIKKTFKMLSQF